MSELKISQSDAKTPDELCALLRHHHGIRQLAISLEDGVYPITPTREWADSNVIDENPGFRFGPEWTLDGRGKATLKVDYSSISDDQLDEIPMSAIISTELRFDQTRLNLHTPEEGWWAQPRGQAVRNLAIDLGFRETVDRYRSRGIKFRMGAVALAGSKAAIEKVHVTNHGSYKYENFPLRIQGAYGMYDRNLIARTDPATHIFDDGVSDSEASHMTGCLVDGYDESSNNQVSAHFIAGSVGERTPGEWVHHYRAFSYQTGNRTIGAPGSNMLQAHTCYQSLRALIEKNFAEGVVAGYYGDYHKTKAVTIRFNEFGTDALPCYHGIQIQLSPTAEGMGNAADYFSHEDYDLGPNKIVSRAHQVKLDTLGPPTATRFMRGFKVDASLSLDNQGAEVTRTGIEAQERGGCAWLRLGR